MKFKLNFFFLFFFFFTLLPLKILAQTSDSSLNNPSTLSVALQARHSSISKEKAIELSGGEENATKELLALRFSEVPGVAYKAQRLLLLFAEDEEVLTALDEDLEDFSRLGLARITVANIDLLQSSSSRLKLAKKLATSAALTEDSSSSSEVSSSSSVSSQSKLIENEVALEEETEEQELTNESYEKELLKILLESTDLDVVEIAKNALEAN